MKRYTHRLIIKVLVLLSLTLPLKSLLAQNNVRVFEHKVQAKETLYGLARRYNTDIESIRRLNPWLKVEGLKIGDKLMIRLNSKQKVQPTKKSIDYDIHIVQKGETLYGISRLYGVSINELLLKNPSISRERFVIGAKLIVPKAKARPKTKPIRSAEPIARDTIVPVEPIEPIVSKQEFEDERYVDVLLILPFEKNSYYVEFYEGFLMALNDLRKQGLSVRLTAEIANDERELKELLDTGILEGKELVIAGTNPTELRLLTKGVQEEDAYLLSPFVSADYINLRGHNFIELHQETSVLEDASIEYLVKSFSRFPIVFLNNGSGEETSFVQKLKRKLRQEQIDFSSKRVSLGEPIFALTNTIFIPEQADKVFAQELMSVLPQAVPYRLFAYPQWQSYGRDFEKLMYKHNTTIYSSFYLNLQMKEVRDFLVKYRAWFDKKVGANYPKYSLLAYDIARYFIRAYALYKENFPDFAYSLPYDGLQMDIQLSKEGSLYRNKRFYWITFSPDGKIERKSLQY